MFSVWNNSRAILGVIRHQVTLTFWWAISGLPSINSFIGSTGQYLVLQKAFWFLYPCLWLLGKHFSFVITWCLDGNAWIALLKWFTFSYVTSASGMPGNINTVYLVNYLYRSLGWGGEKREGIKFGSRHPVSPWIRESWSREVLWKSHLLHLGATHPLPEYF